MSLADGGNDQKAFQAFDFKRITIRFHVTMDGDTGTSGAALCSEAVKACKIGHYDGHYVDVGTGAQLKTVAQLTTPGQDGGHVVDDSLTPSDSALVSGSFSVDISLPMLFASMEKDPTVNLELYGSAEIVGAGTVALEDVYATVDLEVHGEFKTFSRMGFRVTLIPLQTSDQLTFARGRMCTAALMELESGITLSSAKLDLGAHGVLEYTPTELQAAWASYKQATTVDISKHLFAGPWGPDVNKTLRYTLSGAPSASNLYVIEESERIVLRGGQAEALPPGDEKGVKEGGFWSFLNKDI